jgi:oligosaccharide repeat unit polymerase
MAHDELTSYLAIMTVSLGVVVASIVAISIKDKSWINWYTFPAAQKVGAIYVLPAIYMWTIGPTGSTFAYVYYYASCAAVSLLTAASYCYLRPVRIPQRPGGRISKLRALPWTLLLMAFLLYSPVLIAFHQFLGQPREIYANFSAAGYGLNFFGSAALVSLGFITYLFKETKNALGYFIFIAACTGLIYLHGSKGQLLSLALIGILYRVYIKRRKATFKMASLIIGCIALLTALLFTIFGTVSDQIELIDHMAGYADYSRNAMMVIDDPTLPRYLGQLEFEEEFYSRMPRILVPNKPRAFGQVRLTLRYYPAWFRDSAGTPSFDIGEQYADFGAAAIFVLGAGAVFTGWLARSISASLALRPSLGRFLVLLFLSGISLIPLGAGYLLPETILVAAALSFFQRKSVHLLKPHPRTQDGAITL